jgi:hypothetical protein
LDAEKYEEPEEYKVDKITGEKTIKGKTHYIVDWVGYAKPTHEPRESLEADGLINDALEDYIKRRDSAKINGSKRRKTLGRVGNL